MTLHGFWGKGDDLAPLAEELCRQKLIDDWWGPNLIEPGILGPDLEFDKWTESFVSEIKRRAQGEEVMALGYSLGGRLLLHAISSHQDHFSKAIIVSAQVELKTSEEIHCRKLWELNWCLAFKTKNWEEIWRDWNHMEVLSGSYQRVLPIEESFSREYLGKALKIWSPTRHSIKIQDFEAFAKPLLWIAGQRDLKYSEIYQRFRQNDKLGAVKIVANAGHRVHLDQPEAFTQLVSQFVGA